MSIIKDNCVVELEYKLSKKDGEVVDSSDNEGPLKYVHGKKRVSPELEEKLEGRKLGEEFSFIVSPENAYGVRNENLVQFAKKELFGSDFKNIEVGMPLEVANPDGETTIVIAVEVKDDGIIIDGNHPLAGEELTYEIKVLSIKEATEEDLES